MRLSSIDRKDSSPPGEFLTSSGDSKVQQFENLCSTLVCHKVWTSLSFRTGVPKRQHQNHVENVLTHGFLCPIPPTFWFLSPGMGPQNSHFYQVSRWSWHCPSGDHTLQNHCFTLNRRQLLCYMDLLELTVSAGGVSLILSASFYIISVLALPVLWGMLP